MLNVLYMLKQNNETCCNHLHGAGDEGERDGSGEPNQDIL
jgi:hypothetical protein